MFRTTFLSELKYSLRQPLVYIFIVIFVLLEFFPTVSDQVQIGGAIGNYNRNSPFTLTQHLTLLSLLSLVMVITFFNDAALRDYKHQFHEILFSTPLGKAAYFFGRFLGALLIATLPLLGVFVGMIAGTYLNSTFGWLDRSSYGPFTLDMFLNNYLLFILPNMFLAGAIIYALAHKWQSTVISFLGGLMIIATYLISTSLNSDISNESLAGLSDMFGINTYDLATKYFTPIEKNTISPSFSGLLLQNRLIWTSIGGMVLLWSYAQFSFKPNQKRRKGKEERPTRKEAILKPPRIKPAFNRETSWIQFKSFFHMNVVSILKSATFKILFLFCIIILVIDLSNGFENLGLQSYPLTYIILDSIEGKTKLFLIVVAIFFSGELIWRDREAHINEVIDASAHVSLISMLAKVLSLMSIVVIFNLVFILVGCAYQLFNGFTRIELDVYFLDFFYSDLPLFMTFSGITILVQVLSSNKYLAYFIAILILFVFESVLQILDIRSSMLYVINGPFLQYSDMDRFGPGLEATLWFNLYWVLLATLGMLVAGALWNRGSKKSLSERFARAKKEVPMRYRGVIVLTTSLWLLVASIVYYNTQILNTYHSHSTQEELAAAYEKKYGPYKDRGFPKITAIKYAIDIFPAKRNVHVKADIELTNETSAPIDSLHIHSQEGWESKLRIPYAKIVYTDEAYQYSIYELDSPLCPGESKVIHIDNAYITKGFKNDRGNTDICHNGTFFDNSDILPIIGYHDEIELRDDNARRKYGLLPKEGMPKLSASIGKAHMGTYGFKGKSDFIQVETLISTSKDQLAVAPGSLINQWEENDRKYFHYKIDTISLNFYSFLSADYEVARRRWKGVDMEVYYDKKHDVNVEMMLDAIERSLVYYTENFGPYYHQQARIIEFPRYAKFAAAYPGTMPYSEAFGFVMNMEDSTDNNVINWVVAHEISHQWWAHQVMGANMQGAKVLSESFAEYSSLMTIKSITDNPMKMRKYLTYNHDGYLRGRGGERGKELPLYKSENQGYIHYGKGSIILFALQDYIGEERVNAAMKNFLDEYKYKGPPYPSTLDFLRQLETQVPDSLKYLIEDGFKEITLYDNRLEDASYEKLANGQYQVTLEVESFKIKSDSLGHESKVPINDWIDIGFFMDEQEERLYHSERVKFDQDHTSIRVLLDSLPVKAAIDPRHLLIDRVYSDNIKSLHAK